MKAVTQSGLRRPYPVERPCPVEGGAERGSVLLLGMLFLVLLALIAGTTMGTATLELQMAGNAQFRESAFQTAQSLATALSEREEHFALTGAVGYARCERGGSCDDPSLEILPALAEAGPGVHIHYRVVRQGPLLADGIPLRLGEGDVSSEHAFDAALFEVLVTVDASEARLGRSMVVEGLARRVPASVQ